MKKEQYLIVVDLDGTLFMNFKEYDIKSTNLLKELKKDHKIVIATGRPFRSSGYYRKLLNLDTPIVNYNGALVHNPSDEGFKKYTITLNKQYLIDFINDNEDIILNSFCEIEDEIYLSKNDDFITPYLHLEGGKLNIGKLEQILPSDPNGGMIFVKKGSEPRLEKYVNDKYQGKAKIRFWNDDKFIICELYNPLVSKGAAIERISEYYNIPQDHIIAIGDGHNDIEMLKHAKISVAMGNAHKDLIKYAKYHTSSVQENGVYEFLNNFFKDI